jgi:hypothetical protein
MRPNSNPASASGLIPHVFPAGALPKKSNRHSERRQESAFSFPRGWACPLVARRFLAVRFSTSTTITLVIPNGVREVRNLSLWN